MVRVTTVSNVLSGIGLAVLAFAVIFKYLPETSTSQYPNYAWLVGAALSVIVIIMSIVNTFTEVTGFVHPDDKLISNMFVFLMAIATILIYGILDLGISFQSSIYGVGSMIVIAYVFLFVFLIFRETIMKGGEKGKVKEMTARFMLVSLFLGAVMAAIKFGLEYTYFYLGSYAQASLVLGIFAVVLVIVIAIVLGRRYEPVAQ
ncbi:MAG: hypothetical protein C4K47_08280 [Candidatus Thorarchaeota archaeon]|nr:MAG: hypothetical protein C4K47_08280 [Candidatus Thorarchaeota archaeon]